MIATFERNLQYFLSHSRSHYPSALLSKPQKISTSRWVNFNVVIRSLTLTLLMWRIRWVPNNASKWQMGFNSAFKGLNWKCPCRIADFTAPCSGKLWRQTFTPAARSLVLLSATLFLYRAKHYTLPLMVYFPFNLV